MNVSIDKSFVKDAKKLSPALQLKIQVLIDHIQHASSISEVGCEKLSGSQNAYKIRIGNYRIGLYKEDSNLILSRILNRKEIYRYFPKK